MARVAGIELQDNWKVGYALTRIKGVGWSTSLSILASLKIAESKKISDLTSEQLASIISKLDDYQTEGTLIRIIRQNIQRLKTIGSYRGLRHSKGLPSRGQRTRSNARTKRGKRKTVGAYRKEMLSRIQAAKKEKARSEEG